MRAGKLVCRVQKLGVTPLVVPGNWIEGLSTRPAYGVQFAEVSVDTETGLVTVKKLSASTTVVSSLTR